MLLYSTRDTSCLGSMGLDDMTLVHNEPRHNARSGWGKGDLGTEKNSTIANKLTDCFDRWHPPLQR